MAGPSVAFSDQLHSEKYRLKGESFEGAMIRNANALSDSAEHYEAYLDILLNMRFCPAGRVQAWAGAPKVVTPYNCFVSATINDSFVDPPKPGEDQNAVSIMKAAEMAAQTMRQGGGIGYDFSTLRPAGDIIKGVMSKSDGPLAFMPIFNAVCQATASAGNRRGAMMGTMRIDHPDIERFIESKRNGNALNGFNISILVTDEFMMALESGDSFPLKFNGVIYRWISAADLWEKIMQSTWDWAEPGVLFVDTINNMNNLYYCETIASTNPCSEQPLPPYGACLLGSLNLVSYVVKGITDCQAGYFDWDKFRADIPHIVRALDNVIDKATYPLVQQAAEAKNKRRMGIGIMGLANALEALGAPYGSRQFVWMEGEILTVLRDECYRASIELAKEKGAFPLFDAEKYCAGRFIKTLPDDIQDAIRQHGIRNSHLTSIAPTGTISLCADNVSSGIEPVFSIRQKRTVKMSKGDVEEDFLDYGFKFFGVEGKTTAQVSTQEHIDVLVAAANLVDSSVSKTINVDDTCKWEDFANIYYEVWRRGGKGCTTFNKNGKREGILKDMDEPKDKACFFDPTTGQRTCE